MTKKIKISLIRYNLLRISLLIVLCILSSKGISQSITYDWHFQAGYEDFDNVNDLAYDSEGNIIFVGRFQKITQFGGQIYNFNWDIRIGYICKISPNGEILWFAPIRAALNSAVTVIDVTINENDNITVFGSFEGVMYPNPSDNDHALITEDQKGFILKFSNDGKFLDSKTFYYTNYDYSFWGGSVSEDNHYFVIDAAIPTADQSHYLSSISKIDTNSNFVDYVELAVNSPFNLLTEMLLSENKVFAVGYAAGTGDITFLEEKIDLDFGKGVDGIILKSDQNFDNYWIYQIESIGDESICILYSIGEDESGNIYASGLIRGMVNFDRTGSNQIIDTGGSDVFNAFVIKIDKEGVFKWVKILKGRSASTVTVDHNNHIFVASVGVGQIYLNKLNSDGDPILEKSIICRSCAVFGSTLNRNLDLYLGINFNEEIIPETDGTPISSNGSQDIIILKYQENMQTSALIEDPTLPVNIFPNPISKSLNIKSDGRKASALVYDRSGKLIFRSNISKELSTLSIETKPGMYFLKYLDENNHSFKILPFIKMD